MQPVIDYLLPSTEQIWERAVKHGDLKTVQKLIRRNCQDKIPARFNQAPLIYSLYYYQPDSKTHQAMIQWLIKDQNNINSQNCKDWHAIHYAASFGYAGVVQMLIEHNVDLNIQTKEMGSTPLYLATQSKCLEVCKLLLEYKADVNCQDKHKQTPLQNACLKAEIPTMTLLLDAKADPNLGVDDKLTPEYFVKFSRNEDAQKLLRKYMN